jgi:polar amino acid transport system permease protein
MILQTFFNTDIFVAALPILLRGLALTLLLAALVVPLGFGFGLLLAIGATSHHRWLRAALVVWVDFFRAFPPLVLLVLFYAGLPFAGINLNPFGCVAIGLCLNAGSYYGEILRAGLLSVPKGLNEAARSTGLSWMQAIWYVVLPPALRNVLPDLLSNTLELVKLTSLASVVSLPELLFQARQAQSVTYNDTPIVAAAALYFLLLWPFVRWLSRLENRSIAAGR